MSRIEEALEKAAKLRQQPLTGDMNEAEGRQGSLMTAEIPPNTFPVREQPINLDNPLLVSSTDPASPIAEEYRKLKTSLLAMARQREFANVIMVTSSIASEGKSITAINLALSLAQEMDYTVLLIDADLRKPSVGSYLGIEASLGLTDVLEGRAGVNEVLVHTGLGRLVVLPAGKVATNPVELFSSALMSNLLKEIKNRYPDRFIIIDTPPILPFAETRSLARLSDGVLLIVKERLTLPSNLAESIGAIDADKILGIVYNEATSATGDSRYGHYYSSYRYGNRASGSEVNALQPESK